MTEIGSPGGTLKTSKNPVDSMNPSKNPEDPWHPTPSKIAFLCK